MKASLCLAIVVSVVLSAFALPAPAAAADTFISVSYVRLTYVGRSSTGTDGVVALVFVRDASNRRVAGATVTVQWTTPGGQNEVQSEVTGTTGVAWFRIWDGQGDYTLTVTNVQAVGYQWVDTTGSGVDAAVTTLPWTRR